nr:SalLc protein - vaccinia virus (strain WR) [Vaccinia virus]
MGNVRIFLSLMSLSIEITHPPTELIQSIIVDSLWGIRWYISLSFTTSTLKMLVRSTVSSICLLISSDIIF